MQQRINAKNKIMKSRTLKPLSLSLSLLTRVGQQRASECKRTQASASGKLSSARADDRMQGVLIGNGGEEGRHKRKPRK